MSDEVASLAKVPLFAHVGDASLRRLARRSARRSVDAGSIVVVQGQRADHLIVVASGTLTAMHDTAHGRRLRLGDFTGPCAIDKTAVLDAGGYTATWVAATHSQLRLVPRGDLLDVIENVAAARQHVLIHLAQQVRQQQQSLVNTRFGDTTTRVAAWLVRAAGEHGTRVLLPGAQEGLGEAVGVTRVSVNRALRSLARDELIRTERGAVTILAPELLAHRADVGRSH
jgi:CRP/FNR family cyclic AMP-dependent transcriptional regulator